MTIDATTLKEFKDTIHRFTRERLVPLEEQVAEDNKIPDEIISEMKKLGLFGLSTPEEYGGLGLTSSQETELGIELCWSSAAFRSTVGINLGLGSQSILRDGTQEQKDYWLPKIASGEVITSFCLTEPDSGSDSAALRTSAVMDGNSYVINGSKRYVTNGPIAGVFLVMARTSQENLPKNRHITAFLVPSDTPGVNLGAKDRKMGQSGAWSSDVYFDNVRVPADAIIGGAEGKGFATAMASLDRGRINVAAVCVGQARRILHEAVKYATERKQFGQAIGEFQLIQAMLADSKADLFAAECMLRETARRFDAGERVSVEASCTKMFTSEMVGRIADRAVQIHGGAGYMKDSAVERFYRDVRLFRIYEGTTQIQQIIIGKALVREMAQALA